MVNEPLTKDKPLDAEGLIFCDDCWSWMTKDDLKVCKHTNFNEWYRKHEVASAVRLLREKIDENLSKEMRRIFRIEKKYERKGDVVNARDYRHCGMTLGINAKSEVRKAIDEVFGGVDVK